MEIGYVILQKNDEQVEWNDVQLLNGINFLIRAESRI